MLWKKIPMKETFQLCNRITCSFNQLKFAMQSEYSHPQGWPPSPCAWLCHIVRTQGEMARDCRKSCICLHCHILLTVTPTALLRATGLRRGNNILFGKYTLKICSVNAIGVSSNAIISLKQLKFFIYPVSLIFIMNFNTV